jgi:diguanylate cyclase (GGDEF)-like protein
MGVTVSSSLSRLGRHVPAQYFWPVLLLLGTCFGCILILLFSTTHAQDSLQAERERQGLEGALANSSAMVLRDLEDYSKWDDAVRHVARRLEPEWIADNITAYLGGTQGYDHIFALDGTDRTLYAFSDGKLTHRDALSLLGNEFRSALRDVRNLPIDGTPILSGFSRSGDRMLVFSVGAVVPLTGKIHLQSGPTYVLVIARWIDADYLKQIERNEHLAPLKMHFIRPPPSIPAVAMKGHDGRAVAWLSWAPTRPGSALRQDVLPTFLAVAALALIAAGLILRRGGRTIEALRQSEARAQYHANHDPLTGLPNRRALVASIHDTIAAERHAALLYMDLDGFKDANDIYGHAAGDGLLRDAARRIEAAAPDALVARAGGDEFAVLFVDTPDPERVDAAADRILDAFRHPFPIGAYSVKVGVSLGSARHDPDASDGEDELMRRADVAMYAAKADGKNCCRTYHPRMDHGHDLRLRMEGDLRASLESGDIRVLFQPIVDATTGALVSVEALSRWTHPVHGDVPPDVFIPLAEMSGLISAVGRHVLTRACIETRDLDLSVAVNLSPAQFWDRNLAQDVRAVLAETGFPADRLELEITESYLLRRPDAAAAVIDDLRTLGIRIALDDFGTGFASIGYLRQLSFDRLKIDREFIHPLSTDPKAAELVSAIVALARALRLEITAEGVETQAQADIARLTGCTRLQGWLFGQPMSAAELRGVCLSAQKWKPIRAART